MNARDDLDGDDRRDHQVDHETERRPPPCVADKLSPVLPEVLESVAGKADDKQPGCAGDRCGGDYHEHAGDADLDGENDVDRRDHRKPERVDSRRVEPPESKRCGRLRDSDDQSPPNSRGSQPGPDRLRNSAHLRSRRGEAPPGSSDGAGNGLVDQTVADAHLDSTLSPDCGVTSKLNIIPLSWCSAM